MADLNEQIATVTRKKWDRANKIRIDNEYGKIPVITFEVQTATTDDGVLTGVVPKAMLQVDFDPTATYPLLDPRDDTVIPDDLLPMFPRHMQIQITVYSLFRFRAGA